MVDGHVVNHEQIEAADEVAQERRMNMDRYAVTTDNVVSQSEHARAGMKLLEAKARFYRALGDAASLIALAGAAAILIEVIK